MNLDPPDDHPPEVETIRVWKVTKSETTGRVSGTRKTHLHFHEGPSEPSREEEVFIFEDVTTPAGQESSKRPPKAAAKRKRVRVVKENDSVSPANISPKAVLTHQQTKMADWLLYSSTVADELVRKEGLGDSTTPGACVTCKEQVGRYRCRDCFGGYMRCSRCIVSAHSELPLHRLQVSSELAIQSPGGATDIFIPGLDEGLLQARDTWESRSGRQPRTHRGTLPHVHGNSEDTCH